MFVILTISCNVSSPVKDIQYVTVKDTIVEQNYVNKIKLLEQELNLTKDSLKLITDSLNEDLFVANYKLARIKKYNEIAAKGNNIKYLRGWIRRALEE